MSADGPTGAAAPVTSTQEASQPPGPADRLARAALSRISEPGDRELRRLVSRFGAGQVLAGVLAGDLPSRRLADYRSRAGLVDPERDLEVAARAGIHLVCPGELEWPSQLDGLAVPPLALWVRGPADLRRWALRSVSIVGARACTAYGQHVAGELAAELAERGWTVVSGAAYGIDAAAHRGALAMRGQTVAVLACGVDVCYPRANEDLLARIATEGAIVSELPPGCTVTKPRFLERNRVIAALSRGTVVVEAAARSGTSTTANAAAQLGRSVMAVPGPVTSVMSVGCHELVRAGQAALVTDAADVLDLVGAIGADCSPARRGEQRPVDGLDVVTLRVLEALPARRTTTVDKLVTVAGLDPGTVMRALGTLVSLGLAQSQHGQWRLAGAARPDASRSGTPALPSMR